MESTVRLPAMILLKFTVINNLPLILSETAWLRVCVCSPVWDQSGGCTHLVGDARAVHVEVAVEDRIVL